MRVIFYWKCLKFNPRFKNAAKNREKTFCFWDICIWIGIVKLSLWRTRYFFSAANVLTCNPRFFMSIRETFSDSISLALIDEFDKGAVICSWVCLPCCFSKGSLKGDFLDIYLTTFAESVTSKIQSLWGLSFFVQMFKI